MALKKFCNKQGCKNMIPITERYCEVHKTETTIRHKEYDSARRNQRSEAFYKSSGWIRKRVDVLDLDNHIDVYIFMTEGRIKKANTVHHIEELENNWELRLDENNLISLSSSTHSKIEKIYKKDSINIKIALKKMLVAYRNMIRGAPSA